MTGDQLTEAIRVAIHTLSQGIGREFKVVKSLIGSGVLSTSARTIIGAINELRAAQSSAAGINDASASTSSTYSSSKVTSLLQGKLDTSAPLPASQLTGFIDPARLPVLSVIKAFNSAAVSIATLSQNDQDQLSTTGGIGSYNAVRISTGELYIFNGGSKIDVTSYTLVTDITPDWSSITNKPTSAAGYGLSDLLTLSDVRTEIGSSSATIHVGADGAVGGGTGDQRAAIQSVLNRAGGRVVVFDRQTTYNIGGRLILPIGCRIEGNGAILKMLNHQAENKVAGNDTRPAVLVNHQCRVKGLFVDGNNKVCDGFVGVFANDWALEECGAYHYGFKFGMADIACETVTYRANKVYESPGFGIHSYKSTGVRVLNNFVWITTSGYYTAWCKDVIVAFNTFDHSSDVSDDFEGGHHCYSYNNTIRSFKLAGLSIYSGAGPDQENYAPFQLIHRNNTVHQTATYKKYTIAGGVGTITDEPVSIEEIGGCEFYSYLDGQYECGFENNTIHVDSGAGPAFRANQRGGKGGASGFFTANKVFSADYFFKVLDFEGLTISKNEFKGLPGSEDKENEYREQHNGSLINNTFEYVNTKVDNYVVKCNTQTGYASEKTFIGGNKFINTDDWALKIDPFLRNAAWYVEVSDNSLTNYYRPKAGVEVTANAIANGSVVFRNQRLKYLLPVGTTNLQSLTALDRTGGNKVVGDMTYGRPDYMGWAGMIYYMKTSSVIVTQLQGGFGLEVSAANSTLTLGNSGEIAGAVGRLDVMVNSI